MSTPVSFLRDDVRLQGRFHGAPGDGPLPTVVLLHGGPGNEEDVLGLGARLSASGYNVLTFNYSGTHKSEGLSSFAATQADIAAAFRFVTENSSSLEVDTRRLTLGGWSYGGGMALIYAASHPEIDAVFSIAGTDHGEFMREYRSDEAYQQMVDRMFGELARPDSPWRLAPGATPSELRDSGSDVSPYDLVQSAPALVDRRLLLIGGWDDTNVKLERHILPLYRALAAAGAANVTVRALQDDHTFENVRDDLADLILDWMNQTDQPPQNGFIPV